MFFIKNMKSNLKLKKHQARTITYLFLCTFLMLPFQNCGAPLKPSNANNSSGNPDGQSTITYSWSISTWSTCSATQCGTQGTQTRTVQCVTNLNQVVSDTNCTEPKPITTQSCQAAQCAQYTYSWVTGSWSSCSATQCGTQGVQTRSVQCYRNDNILSDDSNCTLPKPISSQSCQAPACVTYSWIIGNWGSCSATQCGTQGSQLRTVECRNSNNQLSNDNLCPQPKPTVSQSCQAPACQAQITNESILVHNFSTGDGPADLVSNGIPFKQGVLTQPNLLRILDGSTEIPIATKVLARWPSDNSIRVLLVQFLAPFSTATKSFTVSIGQARATQDRQLQIVNFRYPRKIGLMTPQYLTRSLVFWDQKPLGASGSQAWDSKQLNRFSSINVEPNSTNTCSRADQYYDSISTSYQMYVRSGELSHFTNGRRWAVHHRSNQIHLTGTNTGFPRCTGGYLTNTRYTFVDGLVRDYFFWGDEESLRVAGLVVDNFYVPHESRWYYQAPNTRRFWTEREAAFAQLGLLAYYEATGNQQYLNLARTRFQSLYQMQVDNNNGAWVHNLYDHDPTEGCPENAYGSSSFMSGLLAESLIRYHRMTNDTMARSSILMAADYLMANNVATASGAGRGFVYLGCRTVYNDANPDIDSMLVHLFGYAYRLSGFTNTAYLNLGNNVFNYTVDNGFAGAAKQYNQQFRSSGFYLTYIDPNY